MTKKREFPNRHNNSVLEEISERYFRNKLPSPWVVDKPKDFGIDLTVTPVINGNVIGMYFSVQLKATKELKGKIQVRLKKTTLNYLFNRLEPVMIILYEEKNDTAYWKWLLPSDFDLAKDMQSHSVPFDKGQIIANVNWVGICDVIQKWFKVKNHLLTSLEYDLFSSESEGEVKAWSHYFGGNLEEASFYFKRVIQQSGPKAELLLALAQCQYQTYDYRNAIITINSALSFRPDDELVLLTKGCILAEDGIRNGEGRHLVEAKEIFVALYGKSPTAIHAYNYANTISKLGMLSEAEELYKQAIKLSPNYAEAWKNLGQVYYDMRKHDLEMACYDEALSINPKLYQARISRAITDGFIYCNYNESLASIHECIKADDRVFVEFPIIYYWLGLFYYEIDQTKMALIWIDKGISNNPSNKLLISLKATILFESVYLKKTYIEEAILFFTRNYEINREDSVNFYYLCVTLLTSGDEAKASSLSSDWLRLRQFTPIFLGPLEKGIELPEKLKLIKHWEIVQKYIVQYPFDRISIDLESSDLKEFEDFLKLFEIARMKFLSEVVELLNQNQNYTVLKVLITDLFKKNFFSIDLQKVTALIKESPIDLEKFAKQFAAVAVILGNLYMVELFRCVGYAIGHRNNEREKALLDLVVDSGLMIETILFYSKHFYRHFGLPMGNVE